MKQKQLLKTLLAAVCLLVGTNAWAGKVTETYDFGAFITANGTGNLTTSGDAIEQSGTSAKVGSVKVIDNLTVNNVTLDLKGRFAVDYPYNANVNIRFIWRSSSTNYQHGLAGNWNQNKNNTVPADAQGAARFSVLNLKAGDIITFTYAKQSGKAADPYTCSASQLTGVAVDAALVSGTPYTVAADGNLDLYFTNNNFAISKIVIETTSDDEVVSAPEISSAYVPGGNRSVTITDGVSSESNSVTSYYTTDGTEPTSSSTAYNGAFEVSENCTVKAISISSASVSSDVATKNITVGVLQLNAPTFSRSGNTVTITANQSGIEGNPEATIKVKYNSNEFSTYSKAITVAADATITAYAEAGGYTTSENAIRAVALLPTASTAGMTQTDNVTNGSGTEYTTLTRGEETTKTKGIYSAVLLDGEQWGNNVYFQNEGWNFRSKNTWYISSNNNSTYYLLMQTMKAGDIIIVRSSKKSNDMVNATFAEKYSVDGNYAYIVSSDGDVELGFQRVDSKNHNYVTGVQIYTHNVTGTAIGDVNNATAYLGATSEKVTLTPGSTYHYQFKNYNTGGNGNWNNFYLVAYDNNDVEKVIVRADKFEVKDWKNTGFTEDINWTNFVSKMNGATVDMVVSYTAENVLQMNSTITTSDASTWHYSYTSNYTGSGISLSDDIKIALSVDMSWLDLTLAEAVTSVSKTISSAGWSTYCSPYVLDFSNSIEHLDAAYIVTGGKNGVLKTTPVAGAVPANTGLLLKGDANANVTIPVAATATADVTDNKLKGVTASGQTIDAEAGYVLMASGANAAFYKNKNAFTLSANSAYLPVNFDGNGEARSSFLLFGDDVTGISQVAGGEVKTSGAVYNLNGQRVSNPTKGIYIIDGVKVAIE